MIHSTKKNSNLFIKTLGNAGWCTADVTKKIILRILSGRVSYFTVGSITVINGSAENLPESSREPRFLQQKWKERENNFGFFVAVDVWLVLSISPRHTLYLCFTRTLAQKMCFICMGKELLSSSSIHLIVVNFRWMNFFIVGGLGHCSNYKQLETYVRTYLAMSLSQHSSERKSSFFFYLSYF